MSNGKEALNELQATSGDYDIVLMDIQMPEMDGYSVTKILRDDLKLEIPVVAMTAHAMAGEKEKCLALGMNDYISKPIREAELYDIILRHTKSINGKAGKPPAVIDLDYLRELSKGNKHFETDMIEQFIVQVPEEISVLETSIENKNYEAIRSAAHGLKSSISFVGLSPKLQPILEQIEKYSSAENGNLPAIRQNFELLQNICKQAITEAKSLLV